LNKLTDETKKSLSEEISKYVSEVLNNNNELENNLLD
jgi:phenylpyruvate tautomerase PptA (4-oxalocrotonate tautomerase family)